ncbi:VRR-NUC domain-containing protein [Variovorax sp. LT1P1]|uniref:VRR-NUC domain-containing protein n=1 Tax=Variovorax sp. LT1P1 TaxID=3443730 RepID=UPI003F4553DF
MLLNLIKAMSFATVPNHGRGTFIEAIYAQNVQPHHKVPVATLLAQLAAADVATIRRNVAFLSSRKPVVDDWGNGIKFTKTDCMLDFFPTLEPWMFLGLFRAAGVDLLHRIATKFSQDPYEYRRGWPDLTLWRGNELRFIEVKAPGDRIQPSQRKVIEEFAGPLELDFTLVEVVAAGDGRPLTPA